MQKEVGEKRGNIGEEMVKHDGPESLHFLKLSSHQHFCLTPAEIETTL